MEIKGEEVLDAVNDIIEEQGGFDETLTGSRGLEYLVLQTFDKVFPKKPLRNYRQVEGACRRTRKLLESENEDLALYFDVIRSRLKQKILIMLDPEKKQGLEAFIVAMKSRSEWGIVDLIKFETEDDPTVGIKLKSLCERLYGSDMQLMLSDVLPSDTTTVLSNKFCDRRLKDEQRDVGIRAFAEDFQRQAWCVEDLKTFVIRDCKTGCEVSIGRALHDYCHSSAIYKGDLRKMIKDLLPKEDSRPLLKGFMHHSTKAGKQRDQLRRAGVKAFYERFKYETWSDDDLRDFDLPGLQCAESMTIGATLLGFVKGTHNGSMASMVRRYLPPKSSERLLLNYNVTPNELRVRVLKDFRKEVNGLRWSLDDFFSWSRKNWPPLFKEDSPLYVLQLNEGCEWAENLLDSYSGALTETHLVIDLLHDFELLIQSRPVVSWHKNDLMAFLDRQKKVKYTPRYLIELLPQIFDDDHPLRVSYRGVEPVGVFTVCEQGKEALLEETDIYQWEPSELSGINEFFRTGDSKKLPKELRVVPQSSNGETFQLFIDL